MNKKFAKKRDLQGNVFNCQADFIQTRFNRKVQPSDSKSKKIRCPNSLGSEKMGVEVMYVKTFRLLKGLQF